ncbi:MAG: alpha/beta fold hydrolase [Erythrobacter sp.]
MSGSLRLPVLACCAAFAVLGAGAAYAGPAAGATTTGAAGAAGAAKDSRPAPIATRAFASRSPFSGTRLSPDGTLIATRLVNAGETFVALISTDERRLVHRFAIPKQNEVEWIRWAGSEKLLVSISMKGEFFGEEALYTRLVLVDLKAQQVDVLGKRFSAVIGDDVVYVARDGSYALVAIQRSVYDYPSVMRFELVKDGESTVVEQPRTGVWDWIADDDGVIRLGLGWQNRALKVWYRKQPEDRFRLIETIKEGEFEEKFWDVTQVISGSDQAYVLREGDDGRTGLYLFDLATRQPVEAVFTLPDNDIDDVTIKDGKPLAVFYTDDRERAHWFDRKQAELYASLGKALSEDEVWITSRSDDDTRMLVWAGGEADPGAYYTFDAVHNKLDLLLELRPQVPEGDLAKPGPIAYTARDGTEIHAYLTLPRGREAKGLPLILMPHGGPYGVRDRLAYDDQVQLLANRGYAVIQPNYRGSGGYGDAFSELGAGQIGRAMQDDLDDAMDWAVKEGIADKARVCVVGSSYGGYAAMWAVIRNPERYRCAASFAGVTDWDLMLKYDRRFFTRKAGKQWQARVQGQEAFDLDSVSPYRLAQTLSRPLLVAHGKEDSNVPFSQFTRFRKAAAGASVTPVELVFEDEGHGFDHPENEEKWYDTLAAFLAEHNPVD